MQYKVWDGLRFVSVSAFVATLLHKQGCQPIWLFGKRGKRVTLIVPPHPGGDPNCAIRVYANRMGLHWCNLCKRTTPKGGMVAYCSSCGHKFDDAELHPTPKRVWRQLPPDEWDVSNKVW